MADFKETDLYNPAKEIFEEMGFTVRGEVKDCDLTAVLDGKTVAAELKKSFNITLVYQLLNRQSFADYVYAVIPRPKKGAKDKNWKSMVKLCKRLNFGLITVAVDSPLKFAEIICSPDEINHITNSRKRGLVQKEAASRSGDFNTGGSTGKKILTAYREKSIELLCLVKAYGEVSGQKLKELGYGDGEYSILYRNYYKWFKKAGRGVYCLSEEGEKSLLNPEYLKLVEFYTKKLNID